MMKQSIFYGGYCRAAVLVLLILLLPASVVFAGAWRQPDVVIATSTDINAHMEPVG